MRVALYGATGRAGSRILQELVRRGHEVIAATRDGKVPNATEGVTWKMDDLSKVSRMVTTISGCDAVVSAYAPPPNTTDDLIGVCQRLADAIAQSGVPRLLVVGGAGVLQVAPGLTLLDSGKLPPDWQAIAASHARHLQRFGRLRLTGRTFHPQRSSIQANVPAAIELLKTFCWRMRQARAGSPWRTTPLPWWTSLSSRNIHGPVSRLRGERSA